MKKQVICGLILDELNDNFDIDSHGINFLIKSSSAVVAASSVLQNKDVYGPTRVQSYIESVVPYYTETDCKSHFRMKRSSFEVFIT